ncbi:unnamed protein product [Linum trigynum]|uniref:Uncharacterized protein n=1 Tax=Linum trigynum TaxID=586398 RepID=A0AAV2CFX9_9ROSI
MAEHNPNSADEATPIKAMTNQRVFAEASNLNAVLIEEEKPELTAKEMRQLMAKQNEVIADMQKKMSKVIALMMSKEAMSTAHVAPTAPQQVAGEASESVPASELAPLSQQAPFESPAHEVQQVEPRARVDLSFLEQHLSPQYSPHPPQKNPPSTIKRGNHGRTPKRNATRPPNI